MKSLKTLAVMSVLMLVPVAPAFSHCEIPCGIYDDSARIAEMREDVTTIEKSMKQITEFSTASPVNYNQLIRWVTNKEDHANKLQDVATQYFMFQRVKPADMANSMDWTNYVEQLTLLHQISVEAMKAKQTLDLAHVENLRKLITEFEMAYFGK